jgi:phosphoribosylamine--glycine ligase
MTGLDLAPKGTVIFHSGTKKEGTETLSNGGRVLAVTSFGDTVTAAAAQSNQTLEKIHFEGMFFRTDIGYEFK